MDLEVEGGKEDVVAVATLDDSKVIATTAVKTAGIWNPTHPNVLKVGHPSNLSLTIPRTRTHLDHLVDPGLVEKQLLVQLLAVTTCFLRRSNCR